MRLQRIWTTHLSSVIISIKTSWDKECPKIYCDKKNNVQDILFLSFDDTEDYRYGMQESDGVKVAHFVDKYLDMVDVIIIHCDAGVSRSAGVLYAILKYYEGVDKKWKNLHYFKKFVIIASNFMKRRIVP